MKNDTTLAGHSLTVNSFLVVLQFVAISLLTIGMFSNSTSLSLWTLISGGLLLVVSIFFTFIFKGVLLSATVGRVFVGVVFIVSGLIKANDPIGFGYKLAEYFEDGALAYRFKEWFGMPDFSFEFLIPHVVIIGIVISILEVLLGVLAILGAKMKLTSWLLMGSILFFSFLTWHTYSCNPYHKFTDQNTISVSSKKAIFVQKYVDSKSGNQFKIISKDKENLTFQEQKEVSCVSDCGCFGDALKGSLGRSLFPLESFWKDLILLFFITWIFIKQRRIEPNTIKQNWIIIPISLLLIAGFCILFSWYFPLLFGGIALVFSAWFYRSFSRNQNGHYISIFFVVIASSVFVWFNMKYEPMKDFRGFAVGKNIQSQMVNGKSGVYEQQFTYKNLKTNELKSFSTEEVIQQNIGTQKNKWRFVGVKNKTIVPNIFPSIDSISFNPKTDYNSLPNSFKNIPEIKSQRSVVTKKTIRVRNRISKEIVDVDMNEFKMVNYPKVTFERVDTLTSTSVTENLISALPILKSGKKLIVIVVKDEDSFESIRMNRLKEIISGSKKMNAKVLVISGATEAFNNKLKTKFGKDVAFFRNDNLELRSITRTYPSVLLLKSGTIIGKYGVNSIPTLDYVQKKFYKNK